MILLFACAPSLPKIDSKHFVEDITSRTATAKLYTLGTTHVFYNVGRPIHWADTTILSTHSNIIDFSSRRMNNSIIDGWVVTDSQWHYGLGIPVITGRTSDGWTGFGARQGENTWWARVFRIGYLHKSSMIFQDVGGIPTYNRVNLSRVANTTVMGTTNQDTIVTSLSVSWTGIWSTPGGGDVTLEWIIDGNGLKETIILNEIGRDWIRNNAPPDSAINETFFGVIFQLDLDKIDVVLRGNTVVNLNNTIDDSSKHAMIFKDVQDRTLSWLPVGDIEVPGFKLGFDRDIYRKPLKKLFYQEGGQQLLLVGIRVDQLLTMASGDLEIDPTSGPTVVTTGNQDGYYTSSDARTTTDSFISETDNDGFFSFPLPAIPDVGGNTNVTIDSMFVSADVHNIGGQPTSYMFGVTDEDPATIEFWPNDAAQAPDDLTLIFEQSEQSETFSAGIDVFGRDDSFYEELATGLQALYDSYGVIAVGDTIKICIRNGAADNGNWFGLDVFGEADPPDLYIRWTESAPSGGGGPGNLPQVVYRERYIRFMFTDMQFIL